ncbi:VWA domain-containing protein [bacterium]|nr:VWA domain-containing protein [bacterium]
MKQLWKCIALLLLLQGTALANGILVSNNKNYPGQLLRNRMTRVEVNITGLVAETVVYQEFTNAWSQTTDAVWAFPLPADARATKFLYWRHDTLFQAVLKEQFQSTIPGTGEGGIPAIVNHYVGEDGLKIELKGIEPWTVQRIELHYINVCDYHSGEAVYTYPLATSDLVQWPVDVVEFTIHLDGNTALEDYRMDVDGDVTELERSEQSLTLRSRASKSYIARDMEFRWTADDDSLTVDFFSSKAAGEDGYYATIIRPADTEAATVSLPKRVIFCVDRSSNMYGYPLEQMRSAVKSALQLLDEGDSFEIVAFNHQVEPLHNGFAPATEENIIAAGEWLDNHPASGGTALGTALMIALSLVPDDNLQNIIITMSTGRSPGDPDEITGYNTHNASLVMLGMGASADRARLEMIAEQNAGFARFFDVGTVAAAAMVRTLHSVVRPVMREVRLEYPEVDVHSLRPDPVPPLFAGLHTLTAGRYRNPGSSNMTLFGEGAGGHEEYTFNLDFSGDTTGLHSIAGLLWAKLTIDGMEREIVVHGERQSLKDSLVAISLASGIRCRYTAYIADYTTVLTGVEESASSTALPATTCILGNYPNPFNPQTQILIRITDREAGSALQLRIYDMLGRLVRVIDLSHLAPGTHSILFDGKDSNGLALPSGSYTVILTGPTVHSARNIILSK